MDFCLNLIRTQTLRTKIGLHLLLECVTVDDLQSCPLHYLPKFVDRKAHHANKSVIIIIIIISIFKEDNVFSIIASLTYGPLVNTDIDYYQTFFGLFY